MSKPLISLNHLAEFSKATPNGKKRILNQQITPNKFLVPWYQSAKGSIKRYLRNIDDISPLVEGIDKLEKKSTNTQRQIIDRKVSIEALNKLKYMSLPKMLRTINYELIKVEDNNLALYGIEIKIAPDLIIKGSIGGTVVYGAIKLHLCKSKPFDLSQSKYISTLLYKYLMNKVVKKGEKVIPELCFCLDVFAERVVGSSVDISKEMADIKDLCSEINKIWDSI